VNPSAAAPVALAACAALAVLAVPAAAPATRRPSFTGADVKLPRVDVVLEPVTAAGKPLRFRVPTDLAMLPVEGGAESRVLLVAEKRGDLRWVQLDDGGGGLLLQIRPVGRYPEEGLLGFAFHPKYLENKKIYTYHTDPRGKATTSVVSEWTMEGGPALAEQRLGSQREVIRSPQPQEGHHAGQLAFGPDGMLYLGLGDGGFQGDPGNRAQDPGSFQGKFLRLDVDKPSDGRGYGIPADNPWASGGGPYLPEVWAVGMRNPWRYCFSPDGRLVVADVGQNRWEEIDVVEAGRNYGWSLRESAHCYAEGRERSGNCRDPSLVDPIFEYGHGEGSAIIGGRFWTASSLPDLQGRYVFGDNSNGRLWALRLPEPGTSAPADVAALGRFDVAWTTFGQGRGGEVWGAGFGGAIVRIAAPKAR
jgi:glucose/arabinose dehydrogenase